MTALPATTQGPGRSARHLYRVSERKIDRGEFVPVGRTLHLVDVENLMGGPDASMGNLLASLTDYRVVAPFNDGDHAIIASNPALGVSAKTCWPGARLLVRGGPNGADRALLESVADIRYIAKRYDLIVVGSGDGIFETVVHDYRPLGLAVGVVSRRGSLASGLALTATFVRFLPGTCEPKVAA